MTSLLLAQPKGVSRQFVPEWGTNRIPEKIPLWSAKSPTWHLSGEPTQQFYDLTLLKKSNVRMNDQLIPKPQECTMGEKLIHQPFPAEHPYASHIPRLKTFPSFAMTPEEPKRGYSARNSLPLTSETPAASYDVQIIHKTKGFGDRHEVQALPPSSLKRGLTWHGDQSFNQGVKAHGDRPPCYPIPSTSVFPNILPREGKMAISERTANSTRNLERQQWKTTYERNHTGLGPINQYKLDNLDDKNEIKSTTGQEDDNIYPWFINSFEPARPQKGRTAQAKNPQYGVPKSLGASQDDTGYKRKPTLTEREEHRLLNGAEYMNLPNPDGTEAIWKEWTTANTAEERFNVLSACQSRDAVEPLPVISSIGPKEERRVTYMDELSKEHHETIQQIEASNRWTQLNLLASSHDIAVLDRKLAVSTPKEHPPAFYGHEGKYNEERAGLYVTNYDPAKLSYKLDKDKGKLNLRNTTGSSVDAVHYPMDLNLEADVIRSGIETDPRKVPMFSERPDIYEVFEPFKRDRFIREQQLQPSIINARARVQEGEVILNTSSTGSSFNQQKFLQEYDLDKHSRSEPLALMSAQNQNLANVRVNAVKHVKFADDIINGRGPGIEASKAASSESSNVTLFSPRTPAPSTVRTEPQLLQSQSLQGSPTDEIRSDTKSSQDYLSGLSDAEKLFLSQKSHPTAKNLFKSRASDLGITASSFNFYNSTYGDQYKPSQSMAEDPRYNWEPGCGIPRPQTSLIKIQNSFSKTAAHKSLQESFPENNPNLIDNIHQGRKHEFGSLNAQVLRGTLIYA